MKMNMKIMYFDRQNNPLKITNNSIELPFRLTI